MGALKAAIVPVTPFQQNCSVIVCAATGRAAVVDPGGDLDRVESALARLGGTLEKILLTHGHIDHCGAAGELADAVLRRPRLHAADPFEDVTPFEDLLGA